MPFGAAQALLAITIVTAIRVIFFIHSSPLLDVNVPPSLESARRFGPQFAGGHMRNFVTRFTPRELLSERLTCSTVGRAFLDTR